ncbi:MAG: LPS assembly lipoprotein LptE [candidate division WOR-3 bacterium]
MTCRQLVKLVLVFIAVNGCGYSARSLLPSHVRTIALKSVENSTTQPGLAEELLLQLPVAFNSDRNLRISSLDQSDLILQVLINGFYRTASAYDAAQNIIAYEITISAQFDVHDQSRNEPFYSGTVTSRISYDPAHKTDEAAITEALGKLAQEIVRQIITAW